MGFYSNSQLLQDARRHGVQVHAIDVAVSDWDCTLEPAQNGQPAIRLGLRLVKGLSRDGAQCLLQARAEGTFEDIEDFMLRARLQREDIRALAKADALRRLAGHRRSALWQALGAETPRKNEVVGPSIESLQSDLFDRAEEMQEIEQDYAHTGLSLRRHPLALLRPQLTRRRLYPASVIMQAPHGQLIRTTGIVTGRQAPGTANGTIFVTLEDETGMSNVIIWASLAQRQRKELLSARLLTVFGKVERQGQVVHVIASRLRDDTDLLEGLITHSRDFH